MSQPKNSFATVNEQIINYNKNVLELVSKLNSIFTSNDGSVEFNLTDSNNVLTTYDIPSWGSIQNDIQRMNNNLNTLFGINENGALIQTANNVWKKIVLVDLNKEPNQINNLEVINNFEKRPNHFFDGLLNPSLFINIDLSDKVEDDVRQVLSRRYIIEFERNEDGSLTNIGQNALDSFNTTFRSRVDISLEEFLEWYRTTPGIINPNNPKYDEEYFDLEPSNLSFDGIFSVLETEEDNINKKLWYVLNTLEYENIITNDIKTLKVGDKLLINRAQTSTIYEIIEINTAANNPRIRVERIQGQEAIPVGEGTLKYYSNVTSNKNLRITIGYNERNVLFLKPVNTENYLLAKRWSAGVGYYTNDLTLSSTDSDNGKTMDRFYVEKVMDYGEAVKDLVKTKTPLSIGQIPNVPVLISDNFKVVQINKHLTDNPDKKQIVTKYKEMKKIKSEVTQLDESINNKRKESRLATFKSNNQAKTFNNDLKKLVDKKQTAINLLKSTTDEIITLANNPNANRKITPKYRLRGFWEMPEARLVRGSRPQEVIQFKIEYRYVSLDGNENSPETFNLKNNDGTDRGRAIFSNWTSYKTDIRKRVYNPEEDIYEWEIQDVADVDTPNINQIDVPIQKNERVEIRVKSISEVGYPDTPLESEWSEIFTYDFPDDLSAILDDDEFILNEATREESIVQLKSELGNVDEHLSDQIEIGNTTYYHDASKIFVSLQDAEGREGSVLNYLRYLTDEIKSLKEQLDRTRGVLQVYVVRGDEEFLVNNDQELQFNVECEDYLDQYSEDSSLTGRIYRNSIYSVKDFYVRIINVSKSSALGLVSNRTYDNNNLTYNSNSPQTFWVNDRDELLFNTSTGNTKTQLNYQYLWNVNFDNSNSDNITTKLARNIENDFIAENSNSITDVLSSTEYNVGYNETSILEFVGNNNSLLDNRKWVDESQTVKSASKLLTTVHPSIQNIEDLVENNSDKIKSFKSGQELIIPLNIYFKMNALDKNAGSGKDYDYIDLNNASTTTRHIKKVKFFLENEAENKPFIFRVKFTINRNKVVVQKLGQTNKLTQVSKFKYRPFQPTIFRDDI
jgi:hypothetical protein